MNSSGVWQPGERVSETARVEIRPARGDEFFLTSLIAVNDDDDTILLECGRHDKLNNHVLHKQRLLCSTSLDKIKIQFTCRDIAQVEYEGQPAFRMSLPTDLLRLQRREFYRMTTPIVAPVKCALSVLRNDTPATIELNLVDISCGGIAVLTPADKFTPELGTNYGCTLRLPHSSALRCEVQARNAYMIRLANGKVSQRMGFAFIKMPESLHAAIQRYIMAMERERRMRDTRDS